MPAAHSQLSFFAQCVWGPGISKTTNISFAYFILFFFNVGVEIRIAKKIVWKEVTQSILENEIRNAERVGRGASMLKNASMWIYTSFLFWSFQANWNEDFTEE